jgi:tetratricopeptide (TPR) repeat protein
MLKDQQGLQITTASAEAIAAINRFIQQSLIYGNEAETAILEALLADPTCAIAYAYAGAYYLSQETAADRQRAMPYLNAAHSHSQRITQREQLYIQGIQAWVDGNIERAILCQETIVDRFPQDLMAIQQGQYHYFYEGNTIGLLQIAEKARSRHPDNPHLLGMIAFGLEQCHQLRQAEEVGRQATLLDRHNPWAHHAVAHVLETEGRVEEGIAWMESVAETWENCNSLLYTHNWWHVALFYLRQGNAEKVLSLYDAHIWGRARKHSPKDQVGAISLLLRLELQGVMVDRQWQELAPYLQSRIYEHTLPFQDLHYVYALARSRSPERAHEMLVSMVARAQTLSFSQRRRWMELAIPSARGLMAHAIGNWQEAIAHLKPVLPHLWQLGGSHAQRQLFKQVYADAVQQSDHGRYSVRLTPARALAR